MRIIKLNMVVVLLLVLISACNNEIVQEPIMINSSDTLYMPLKDLEFEAKGDQWEAILNSFTQPIPVKIRYGKNGFHLYPKKDHGIVEGPGRLCLQHGDNKFYYKVYLKNILPPKIEEVDYRSSKIINLDSSNAQQRIFLAVDEWRNIVDAAEGAELFEEEILQLNKKVGVYRAQGHLALSSYYIEPGSCVSIPLKAKYIDIKKVYRIIAGPLKDRYDNLIADGTVVKFICDNGKFTNLMEEISLNGFASIEITAEEVNEYSIFAKVDDAKSLSITLQP